MYTLSELATRVGARLEGDPDTSISGVAPFELAQPGDITLALHPRLVKRLDSMPAAAAIVSGSTGGDFNVLISDNPKLTFARVIELFHPAPATKPGIAPEARIGRDCTIPPDVTILPFAHIGNEVSIGPGTRIHTGTVIGDGCRIGADSVLHSNVTLYPGVELGERAVLHAGCVIGSDGFGYVLDGAKRVKLPQTGGVRIGSDVEIGANSCIDRATFGHTVIEDGVKIDNLVHIAHNVRVGSNTVITGCVGVSGSSTIGKNCVLAGQTGVADHITIGDHASVLARTLVLRDVAAGQVVSGPWGREHRTELKIQALLTRLPNLREEVRTLRRRVEELEKRGDRNEHA